MSTGHSDYQPLTTITISATRLSSPEGQLDSTTTKIALITCFMGSLISLKNSNTGVPFLLCGIFKCHILTFQAFVISLMFAFSTSSSALLLFHSSRLKLARIFRSCSLVCFASAVSLLLYAIFTA
ncbi:hypothetical protein ACH5RR_036028 [Cinchona calisaya]|uniref:Uncharacterized protein n=1 Tax=Cinchona calisaya TaxID=153742 RepID=A0ABD2Y5K9_9GENT